MITIEATLITVTLHVTNAIPEATSRRCKLSRKKGKSQPEVCVCLSGSYQPTSSALCIRHFHGCLSPDCKWWSGWTKICKLLKPTFCCYTYLPGSPLTWGFWSRTMRIAASPETAQHLSSLARQNAASQNDRLNSAHSAFDVGALCSRTQWCEVWVLNLSPVARFCNLDAINEIKQVVGVTAQSALQAFGCTGSAAVVSLDWYIQDLLTECSWLLRMVTRLVQLKRPVYSWSDCHQV